MIEDEAVVAMFLTDVLEELDYQVCAVAASGRQAIELASQHRPDLAMVDVRLKGDIDGVETAVRLQERFGTRSILLSGDPEALRSAESRGIKPVGVLSKPYTPEQLRTILNQAFAPG